MQALVLEVLEALEDLLATVRPGCEEKVPGLTFTRGFSLLTSQDGWG